MRVRLQKGGEFFDIQQLGGQVFLASGTEGSETASTSQTFFDEEAAKAFFEEQCATRRREGWIESKETVEKKRAAENRTREAAARLKLHRRLAAAKDPAAALRRQWNDLVTKEGTRDLDAVLARVRSIEEPDESGFLVRFDGGARLVCAASDGPSGTMPPDLARVLDRVRALWLHLDAGDDHNLFFGIDADPPDPKFELRDTEFASAAVTWFIQELPWDRYWFVPTSPAGPPRCYELDGGLHPPSTLAIGDLLFRRIAALVAIR